MKFELFFPYAIIVQFIIAGIIYLIIDPYDWRKYSYWFGAAILNIAVTF